MRREEVISSKLDLLIKLKNREYGFMLNAPKATYDISIVTNHPIICRVFFKKIVPSLAQEFMMHMASAHPIFGYASTEEERYRWNRVKTIRGNNHIETWVGRDPSKCVPGLYWLTMLSGDLARRHGVAIEALDGVAKDHVLFDKDWHLFRFYDAPEDWRESSGVSDLRTNLTGIFDIEALRPQILAAKTWLEACDVTHAWP